MFYKNKFAELFKTLQFKKIVEGRGHDGMGLIGDIHLKTKKIGTFHDDGWGGEPEIRIINDEVEKQLNDLLTKHNVLENINADLTELEYSFELKGLDEMITHLFEEFIKHKEILKVTKKLSSVGLVSSTPKGTISCAQWGVKPHIPLTKLVTLKGGLKLLQTRYDSIKEKNDIVLNNKEQLEELGITI